MDQQLTDWQVNRDNESVIWLTLDVQGSAVNTLNNNVLQQLDVILDNIIEQENVTALVIRSGKSKGFIAGADVKQFCKINDANDAVQLVRHGQHVFNKLAELASPTIAVIEGFCMGGGLELALACRYRIALDDPSVRLGLPEVKLGIHPGWGGTVRLPQLIGPLAALDLILTGRAVSTSEAKRIGLVDVIVPKRVLQNAIESFIKEPPKVKRIHWTQQILQLPPMRQLIAWILNKKLSKKVNSDHYPAPYAVLDNWLRDGTNGENAMVNEASSVGKLFTTTTCKNLIQVFLLQEQLKKLPKDESFVVQHVHVIGAGIMGGDIAAWCALSGLTVSLYDTQSQLIASSIKRAYQLFQKKLKNPRLVQAAMDRLMPDEKNLGIRLADVIIEAVTEDLTIKQEVFKQCEKLANPSALLATNTSSIPLEQINKVLKNPNRLIGLHYFNPVAMMPLVEIVKTNQTTAIYLQKAIAFVRQIDKLPLPVKSSPGFLINRVLMPYLIEAIRMLDEGIPMVVIDNAAKEFGMPMGPVELADAVGLDVCLSVAKNLSQHYSIVVPDKLEQMVAQKILGRKSGQGFYHYKDGHVVNSKYDKKLIVPNDLCFRLIMPMLNEAAACLREQVVENANLLDAGMIFGTGFAPFRGGPMQYAQTLGKSQLAELFNQLQQQFGDRFRPDVSWELS